MAGRLERSGYRLPPELNREYSRSRRPFLLLTPTVLGTYFAAYLSRNDMALSLSFVGVGLVVMFIIIGFTARRIRTVNRHIRGDKAIWDSQRNPEPPWPKKDW